MSRQRIAGGYSRVEAAERSLELQMQDRGFGGLEYNPMSSAMLPAVGQVLGRLAPPRIDCTACRAVGSPVRVSMRSRVLFVCVLRQQGSSWKLGEPRPRRAKSPSSGRVRTRCGAGTSSDNKSTAAARGICDCCGCQSLRAAVRNGDATAPPCKDWSRGGMRDRRSQSMTS